MRFVRRSNQASGVHRRALSLLAAGAALGIAFGVVSALKESKPNAGALPDDAIALVNGKAIAAEDYARAVATVASDKRSHITEADRAYVLNRLIDEELLIQYGTDMGLVESDRAVRKAITEAILTSIVAEYTSGQPSDDLLRAFYEENPALFVRSSPGRAAGKAGGPPPFDDIRAQVEEVYLQRARDDALREYLAWLRSEAEIILRPDVRPFRVKREGQDEEYAR